jgi:PAS domain S-box-containing protein
MPTIFLNNLVTAISYFLLGEAGLLLAIPPGYASAIFPAAAVGFIAVLHRGWRVLPGVWLGSVSINVGIAMQHGDLSGSDLWMAGLIALGSSAQACLASVLIQSRLKQAWQTLVNDSDILWFLLLAGPLASLVSCSWATLCLWFGGVINISDLSFNWWNWWVGDTLGVLLFSPVLLAMLYRQQVPWQSRLRSVIIPTLLLTFILITIFVFVSNKDIQLQKRNIEGHGQKITHLINLELMAYQENIDALVRLLTISPTLTRADFDQFTLPLFKQHEDVHALSWNPLIKAEQRADFETLLAKENALPDFHITERDASQQLTVAKPREWYVVVGYISPQNGNEKALGFDIASNPIRLNAIQTAMQSGQLTATLPIQLVQDNSKANGLLLLQPIYNKQAADKLPSGFAVGVFKIEGMLKKLINQHLPEGLLFSMEDLQAGYSNGLLYSNLDPQDQMESVMVWKQSLDFGGRQWQITLYTTHSFLIAQRSLLAWAILALGLVTTSLLQAMMLGVTGRTFSIQQHVEQQTQEISRKNVALLENQSHLLFEKEKYQNLLQASGDGIHILDLQGRVRETNPTFCEMLGYRYEEVIGMSVLQWEANFNPEEAVKKIHENFNRANVFETRHRRKDGSIIDVEVSAKAISINGETLLWNASRDISDRKRAEFERARLQAIIMEAPDFIASSDMSAHLTFLNPAGARMVGLPAQVDLSDLEIKDMQPEWATKMVVEEGIPTVLRQGYWQTESALLNRQDGREIPVSQLLLLHRDKNGVPQQLSTIMRDITRFKQTEQALQQARDQAESLARSKSEFLANMSHEIRTPMNAIIGLSQLVLNTPLSAQQHDYLDKILGSSHHLLEILNDILDFSKLEANRLTIVPELFNLNELIHNLESLFYARAQKKSLAFKLDVAEDVPRNLLGDTLRLQQILVNLISNSIKFTEQGFIRLLISVVAPPSEDKVILKFALEDSGIGISKEQQTHLFQPFTQADGSITRRFGGTGLGLVISRKLAQMMGSDIQCRSVIGEGSQFWFDMPFGLSKQPVENASNGPKRNRVTLDQLREATKGLANARVLLVEDNPLNQQVAREFLNAAGFKVITANDGQQALDFLSEQAFDVVLMDIQMPVLDGLQATRLLRNQACFADLPIIAMSAGVTLDEQAQCESAGMTDFIAKPIDPLVMVEKLVKALETRSPGFSATAFPNDSTQTAGAHTPFNLMGFDAERLELLANLLGGHDQVLRSLRQFADDYQTIEQDINHCLDQNQYQVACEKLHGLKGVAANFGATRLAEMAESLEKALKQGRVGNGELRQFCVSWQAIARTLNELQVNPPTIQADNSSSTKDKLLELYNLLADDKLVPAELLNDVSVGLTAPQAEIFKRLSSAISSYDYQKALRILKDLL